MGYLGEQFFPLLSDGRILIPFRQQNGGVVIPYMLVVGLDMDMQILLPGFVECRG
jgi:hypothetical protein